MTSFVTRWRNLGASDAERLAAYPGDELVAEPADNRTLAMTVHAPPGQVWQWLVQIGQGRGGLYRYDRIENLFGPALHSTDRIRGEWQHLAPGDRVFVVAPGKLGMPNGYSFPVERVDHDRCLVLRQCPPEHRWNTVWTFVLEPLPAGRCRLISRRRDQRLPGLRGAILRVVGLVMEPAVVLTTHRLLRGIKQRAETGHLLADLAHLA